MADFSPVFITGASGFIGGKLAERLLKNGDRPVRLLARRPMPALEQLGAQIIRGDLHDLAALRRGCAGAGTVFHVAGRVGVWGPAKDFFRVNVEGTRHLLAAARAAGVPRFVFTSSPSVVFNGGDLAGVDESAPLCTSAPSPYPVTKAQAEREVLAANAPNFSTVALRPHLVIGPGDQNLIPRVLAQARRGKLKIIGPGKNRVDLTHIDNVVDAHLLAERALSVCHIIYDKPSPTPLALSAAGKAYFITNGEPVVLWDWINALLRGIGLPEVKQHVSLNTALLAGRILESAWKILPLTGEPSMTRFVAKEMSTDHWFDLSAARRDLGYTPRVSMAEATAQIIAEQKRASR
ncbi:NAD-dependent epimerase/dehydratase family protein [Oleiharenicola lentus]|uniref:NAD-dependent epimerase/dehydratase family protein n=1 Tax=Oleiharenicola lentus TaxID=2508720 RepID=UPI003F661279